MQEISRPACSSKKHGKDGCSCTLPIPAAECDERHEGSGGIIYSEVRRRYYFTREEARAMAHALQEELVFLAGAYQDAGIDVSSDADWEGCLGLIPQPSLIPGLPGGLYMEPPASAGAASGREARDV